MMERAEITIVKLLKILAWIFMPVSGIGVLIIGCNGIYYFLTEKSVIALFVGSALIPFGGAFFVFSLYLLKLLLGFFNISIPLEYAGRRKRYDPQKLIDELADNLSCNVLVMFNVKGWMRIYGKEESLITEVGVYCEHGYQTFHMIDPAKTKVTNSVMPEADDTPVVIENTYHECFPTRASRIVGKKDVFEFLNKLYECKDFRKAMEGFAFTETTEETQRLVKKNLYVLPQVPLENHFLREKTRNAWEQKQKERAECAILEMKKMDGNA